MLVHVCMSGSMHLAFRILHLTCTCIILRPITPIPEIGPSTDPIHTYDWIMPLLPSYPLPRSVIPLLQPGLYEVYFESMDLSNPLWLLLMILETILIVVMDSIYVTSVFSSTIIER